MSSSLSSLFFFFNDRAPPEIYPLPLHDSLPISLVEAVEAPQRARHEHAVLLQGNQRTQRRRRERSEEHTSELQSHLNLVCRLLLEKKKKQDTHTTHHAPDSHPHTPTHTTYHTYS